MLPITARSWSRIRLALAGLLWLSLVVAGFGILGRYEWSPGAIAAAPAHWPQDVARTLGPARSTLLLFVHPRCPCTRATLEELDRIASRSDDRLRIVGFVLDDPSLRQDGEVGELWARMQAIPGVEVRADPAGASARRFGARTSGQALLYACDGRLLFSGGITGARGHVGENAGAAAVASWVDTGSSPCASTPVYGCPLFAPEPSEDASIRP